MADSHPLDPHIAQVNRRLKAARLGLLIERRGQKLSLRGALPPRPGSHCLRPYQQRIPLGAPATKAGLKQTEQDAKVIAAQLIQKTFDWRHYLQNPGGAPLAQKDLSEKIQAFKHDFFTQRDPTAHPASVKTTWEKAYAPYLRMLSSTAEKHTRLNLSEIMYATVQSTRSNSRSRQVCCTALAAFADFLDLDLPTDLKTLWGTYGNRQMQARELPSDEQIIAAYDKIPNANWRFVYGMMATYGLRNHEVFFCNYTELINRQSEAVIEVQETTKTGRHEVWPFYPEWVERFNLQDVSLPQISTDLNHTTLQRIGQQVTTQFRRYGVPLSPYDLRHAWAVRTILFGLPDTVAARMMGHSVAIHNRTYHRWITHRDQAQAVQTALSRSQMTAPD